MKLRQIAIILISAFAALLPAATSAVSRTSLGKPDLNAIRQASTDPASDFYYPTLLNKFMANDTTMTDEQFQYFYYGTLFQEDYDPYRPIYHAKEHDALKHIYLKDNQSRSERQMMLDYAIAAIEDNPVNIQQIGYRVNVYEKNGKHDLAKIWQYKLNHILLVIAASGTGTDPETARTVVYPEHEYDLLNIAGFTATGQRFEAPHYDYITVKQRNNNDPEGFYFDISEMLRQYFLKHPSEAIDTDQPDDQQPADSVDTPVTQTEP